MKLLSDCTKDDIVPGLRLKSIITGQTGVVHSIVSVPFDFVAAGTSRFFIVYWDVETKYPSYLSLDSLKSYNKVEVLHA